MNVNVPTQVSTSPSAPSPFNCTSDAHTSGPVPVQLPPNDRLNSMSQLSTIYSRRSVLEDTTEEFNDNSSFDYYSSSEEEEDTDEEADDELRSQGHVSNIHNSMNSNNVQHSIDSHIDYQRFIKWNTLHANRLKRQSTSGFTKPKQTTNSSQTVDKKRMQPRNDFHSNAPQQDHHLEIAKYQQMMQEQHVSNNPNKGAPKVRLTRASILRMQHQLKVKNSEEDKATLPQVSMNTYLQNFNQPSILIPNFDDTQPRAHSPLLHNLHYYHDSAKEHYPNPSVKPSIPHSFRLSPIAQTVSSLPKPQPELPKQSGSSSQQKKIVPRSKKQASSKVTSRESQASAIADELRALGYNVD
jgi:hypothetical protein